MSVEDFGTEQTTDEDRAYKGSRFSEVRDALFANPYQRVWGARSEPVLPVHAVTLGGVLRGILPFGTSYLFRKASERTVDSGADLRWGRDGKGFRRLLHPNGVCLSGEWRITEESEYSGYFAKGSAALAIGRYSSCCTETRRGHNRSLSLVGKLFPTTDPNHSTPLRTANFITQQDIGGARTDFINDVELCNAPDTTGLRRGVGLPILLITGAVLGTVDKQPTIRQLYQIAELGESKTQPTQSPQFMRLLVASEQPRVAGDGLDFRDEVMAQIFDKDNPEPKRTLTFYIEVTDDGVTRGTALRQRRTIQNWRRIGTLKFNNAVISYNGDSVIHFNHPTWRSDRNDPSTATRVNERKVR
jgi:hypothetical protein